MVTCTRGRKRGRGSISESEKRRIFWISIYHDTCALSYYSLLFFTFGISLRLTSFSLCLSVCVSALLTSSSNIQNETQKLFSIFYSTLSFWWWDLNFLPSDMRLKLMMFQATVFPSLPPLLCWPHNKNKIISISVYRDIDTN